MTRRVPKYLPCRFAGALRAAGFALAVAAAGDALAQAAGTAAGYPSRPIRIVVPFSPGGVADITPRLIGPRLVQAWGQQVVVDNRPGAGGVIGTEIVARATPDGYTLLSASANHSATPAVRAKLPYDTLRDFAGITLTSSGAYVLIVPAASATKSVQDLVAAARSKPGQLNFGSAGTGSGTHFAGELFKVRAGIEVTHVPYKGIPEALIDTIAGRVQFFLPSLSSVTTVIKDGKVLALAVSGRSRVASFPDVPTIAESGVPGYEWNAWTALLAPAKTPRAIVSRLHHVITGALAHPEVQQRMAAIGAEVSPIAPEQLDRMIAAEVALSADLARKAGIKPE